VPRVRPLAQRHAGNERDPERGQVDGHAHQATLLA
jgi:hypothetical protein